METIETVNDTLSSGLTTPLITAVLIFVYFAFFCSHKQHGRGVWLRLNETETVREALSLGSYDPTHAVTRGKLQYPGHKSWRP